ncbi:MAG: beta-phosphoglucomutase [Dorea sp.]|nr:beta-phosphoglucomutase [Dorea sp.]
MNRTIKGAVFDLDGVLVDTARFHYLAWKKLAEELGFSFSPKQNEALKGVSRMKSLDLLLGIGRLSFPENIKIELAQKKNNWYVQYLQTLTRNDLLDYVLETLTDLRQKGIRTAIGSASKNTPLILEKTKLAGYFDVVVDGNSVSKAKPDPEVFLTAAQRLGISPEECLVFEDSEAGIQAAAAAHMFSIYLGTPSHAVPADLTISNLREFSLSKIVGGM